MTSSPCRSSGVRVTAGSASPTAIVRQVARRRHWPGRCSADRAARRVPPSAVPALRRACRLARPPPGRRAGGRQRGRARPDLVAVDDPAVDQHFDVAAPSKLGRTASTIPVTSSSGSSQALRWKGTGRSSRIAPFASRTRTVVSCGSAPRAGASPPLARRTDVIVPEVRVRLSAAISRMPNGFAPSALVMAIAATGPLVAPAGRASSATRRS
jgi:hypothetical protein